MLGLPQSHVLRTLVVRWDRGVAAKPPPGIGLFLDRPFADVQLCDQVIAGFRLVYMLRECEDREELR